MAYARFSYADVYIYMSVYGYLECAGCVLRGEWSFGSTQEMVDHIAEHREAGHDVPADLEEMLWADDKENFPPQCVEGHDWGEPYQPYPDSEFVSSIWRRKCSRCDWEDHTYTHRDPGPVTGGLSPLGDHQEEGKSNDTTDSDTEG